MKLAEKVIKLYESKNIDLGSKGLETLVGQDIPEKVGGNFNCHDNKLTSLEDAPKEVGGDFDCSDNKKQFTEEEVRAVCKVKGEVFC